MNDLFGNPIKPRSVLRYTTIPLGVSQHDPAIVRVTIFSRFGTEDRIVGGIFDSYYDAKKMMDKFLGDNNNEWAC